MTIVIIILILLRGSTLGIGITVKINNWYNKSFEINVLRERKREKVEWDGEWMRKKARCKRESEMRDKIEEREIQEEREKEEI